MNCGAVVGVTKAVWFDGNDSLAAEMLQRVCTWAVGAAKAGTASSSETIERANMSNEREGSLRFEQGYQQMFIYIL
jgi:hypothetical protein